MSKSLQYQINEINKENTPQGGRKSKTKRIKSLGRKKKLDVEVLKRNEQRISRLEDCVFKHFSSKMSSALKYSEAEETRQNN